jgi:superoxide reductase
MSTLAQFLQSGDWKGEKHVPIIHAPEKAKADEVIEIKLSVGDAIKHPNTLEHHIAWFKLFYIPEGGKFPIELGNFEFKSHGEGETYAESAITTSVQIKKSGTLHALSYCNLHGLWESSKKIIIE